MARYTSKNKISAETRHEAMTIAKGTQSAGQAKAQTKLIAQGIERGIDLYKKQRKEEDRDRDRRQRDKRHQTGRAQEASVASSAELAPASQPQWLPWLLLAVTWAGVAAFWVLKAA
jgi:hypothetical protein